MTEGKKLIGMNISPSFSKDEVHSDNSAILLSNLIWSEKVLSFYFRFTVFVTLLLMRGKPCVCHH